VPQRSANKPNPNGPFWKGRATPASLALSLGRDTSRFRLHISPLSRVKVIPQFPEADTLHIPARSSSSSMKRFKPLWQTLRILTFSKCTVKPYELQAVSC
jgi:hypothetical protein